MGEKNNNVKNFVETVFSAEQNSAATLGEQKLSKYNRIAIRMFHTGVLTPREMLFPAVAELANQILAAVNAYRTLYFVNVLKIDMAYITVILMLIGIYDVLNNPLMGAAYDHTRTRWGKARPYIILTAAPYFLSTAVLYSGALFLGNRPGNDPRKIIFVFVMLFIMETFSTIYSIPRGNMLTLQTVNPKDRITVGLLQNYIGSIGSSVIFALFMPIMELNNKGYINFPAPLLFFSMASLLITMVLYIVLGVFPKRHKDFSFFLFVCYIVAAFMLVITIYSYITEGPQYPPFFKAIIEIGISSLCL